VQVPEWASTAHAWRVAELVQVPEWASTAHAWGRLSEGGSVVPRGVWPCAPRGGAPQSAHARRLASSHCWVCRRSRQYEPGCFQCLPTGESHPRRVLPAEEGLAPGVLAWAESFDCLLSLEKSAAALAGTRSPETRCAPEPTWSKSPFDAPMKAEGGSGSRVGTLRPCLHDSVRRGHLSASTGSAEGGRPYAPVRAPSSGVLSAPTHLCEKAPAWRAPK
jgi:hypothetical protein